MKLKCICRGPTFIYGNDVIEDDMVAEKFLPTWKPS